MTLCTVVVPLFPYPSYKELTIQESESRPESSLTKKPSRDSIGTAQSAKASRPGSAGASADAKYCVLLSSCLFFLLSFAVSSAVLDSLRFLFSVCLSRKFLFLSCALYRPNGLRRQWNSSPSVRSVKLMIYIIICAVLTVALRLCKHANHIPGLQPAPAVPRAPAQLQHAVHGPILLLYILLLIY